jgi:ketose-bisphosphate aldolase
MLKNYLKQAKREGWAVPQFNFSTLEQLKAIKEVSKKLKSPIIVATSEGEAGFFGFEEAVAIVKTYQKEGVAIYLNLDHGSCFENCKNAIDAGYDSIHFDGSKLNFSDNLKITKQIVKYAQKIDSKISVEGELGVIGDAESFDKGANIKLTNINEIEEFAKTEIDRLAVSIGTVHGISTKEQKIDFNILGEISTKSELGLVLHGGSGVNDQDIKKAIKYGIVKININTELRIGFTKGLRDVLSNNKEEIKPYNYFYQAVENTKKIAESKILLFGSNNRQ